MEHQVSNLDYAENIPKAARDINSKLNYRKVLPSGGQRVILQVSDHIVIKKRKRKKKTRKNKLLFHFLSFNLLVMVTQTVLRAASDTSDYCSLRSRMGIFLCKSQWRLYNAL